MAEAALGSCGAAAGTPRKRSRDPDSSCSEFQTPVSKRPRAFPGSPSRNSRCNSWEKLLASQIQWSPSSEEENRDQAALPGKPAPSRRLQIPEGNPGIPSHPQPASSRNSQLPVGAFYGKRTYLDPLERKRLRELLGDGNAPAKHGNSIGNSLGKPGNRSSKGKTKSKGWQKIPKGNSKNSEAGKSRSSDAGNSKNSNVGNSKSSVVGNSKSSEAGNSKSFVVGNSKSSGVGNSKSSEAGNSKNFNAGNSKNSDIGNSKSSEAGNSRRKAEFRVLSVGVRPALRLPLGSAFFQSGKRSRKIPAGKSSGEPGAAARKPPEKSGKAEKSGSEEKENRECSAGFGNEGQEGSAGKSAGNSQGKEESPGIPPSPSPDSQNSDPKKESGSPTGLFPIFLPARRRPLEELPAPFGIGPSGKAPRKSKESSQHSLDQMIIDAGQRQLGALQCGSCGMLYAPGIPEDRLQHLRHHRRLCQALRYPGWKKERVVAEFWDGKIVLILPGDPSYAVRKAQEVLALVDSELGFPAGAAQNSRRNSRIFPERCHVYLFVRAGSGVLGCLVAQPVCQAFRVVPEAGRAAFPEDSRWDSRAWRCWPEPEPAACGVSRLWVLAAQRGQRIARRMMDTLRRTFVFGAVLNSRDLAFSDPTPDGRGFAARYCGRPDFLVYNLLHGETPGSAGSAPGSPGSAGSAPGSPGSSGSAPGSAPGSLGLAPGSALGSAGSAPGSSESAPGSLGSPA